MMDQVISSVKLMLYLQELAERKKNFCTPLSVYRERHKIFIDGYKHGIIYDDTVKSNNSSEFELFGIIEQLDDDYNVVKYADGVMDQISGRYVVAVKVTQENGYVVREIVLISGEKTEIVIRPFGDIDFRI